MGIFTRFRDIIASNVNAMLDCAEDPEKLIKLMIQEMEDTLVELKANCAGAMADAKKIGRELDMVQHKADEWEAKAELALRKGRESLAREALIERRRLTDRAEGLTFEADGMEELVKNCQEEIVQLEQKLAGVKEKQRLLIQRRAHAHGRRRAQRAIRRNDSTDAMARFQAFESRVDRLEAEADLTNFGRRSSLDEEFDLLSKDEDIEAELDELRKKVTPKGSEKNAD